MNWQTLKTVAVAACLSMALASQAGAAPTTIKIERKPSAMVLPAEEVRYVDAGMAGVERAVVSGNAVKGPHHFFLKMKEGTTAGLHHHTADHYGVVVGGTLVLTIDGKETRLPPGSFFSFTGKAQHMTRCEGGGDCLLFIDSRETWDVVPVVPEEEMAKPKVKY